MALDEKQESSRWQHRSVVFLFEYPNTPPILSSLSHIFAPRDYTDTTENSGTASYMIQLEGLLIRLPRPSRLRLPPPQGIYDSDLGREDRGAPSPGHGSSLTATNGSRERVRAARAGVTATCRRPIYLREGANAHGRASADQVVGQEGRERASPASGDPFTDSQSFSRSVSDASSQGTAFSKLLPAIRSCTVPVTADWEGGTAESKSL